MYKLTKVLNHGKITFFTLNSSCGHQQFCYPSRNCGIAIATLTTPTKMTPTVITLTHLDYSIKTHKVFVYILLLLPILIAY